MLIMNKINISVQNLHGINYLTTDCSALTLRFLEEVTFLLGSPHLTNSTYSSPIDILILPELGLRHADCADLRRKAERLFSERREPLLKDYRLCLTHRLGVIYSINRPLSPPCPGQLPGMAQYNSTMYAPTLASRTLSPVATRQPIELPQWHARPSNGRSSRSPLPGPTQTAPFSPLLG